MAFKSLVLALALGAAAAFTPATVARKSTVVAMAKGIPDGAFGA
eukprot:CAMPEP_0172612770 /NCGR_PEP_ID=MMETSP1068-20121228/36932_1 /TAXON_ID=35684 /ORGANISM="Pseudopedinella elastica, Strain CCMP716" /LENGTH=43 /DNA_ID= /DNA_START= /DNA_END= /DNA_ORIENTATION=